MVMHKEMKAIMQKEIHLPPLWLHAHLQLLFTKLNLINNLFIIIIPG